MENVEVAQAFDEVADLLELQGANPFRVRAYRNAARTVRDLAEPLTEIAGDRDRRLDDLPGIGPDLAGKITTLLQTGDLPLRRELRGQVPAGLRDMLDVPGLGPKRAQTLYQQLGIRSLGKLRQAAQRHRLRELKGFGPKTEENILRGLEHLTQAGRRVQLDEAKVYADALTRHLRGAPGLHEVEVAGSFRRRQETVGDLDILVTCDDPEAVMDRLAAYGGVAEVLARGDTRMALRLKTGLQIDLRVVPEESYGAALQYFTGSKAHSILLRRRAQERGLKMNEYGVFRDDQFVAGRTEAEVYAAVGLPWIPPELREARGEIELALAGRLPQLLTLDDVRGDLHMHTDVTDGRASLEEMVDGAGRRGYGYIAITDHSRRVTVAGGLDARRLRAHWKAIDRLAAGVRGMTILKGVELDILEDGTLDLPDDVLRDADWVVASIHYGQNQPRAQITRRLLNAIRNPYVSAIGHPTGRLIGKRKGYDRDLDTVLKAAADHGCLMELNCQPSRLDLDDVALMAAKERGIPIVLGSDAHAVEELAFMEFGVYQARRAGLEARDVANSRPVSQFRKLLSSRRRGRWAMRTGDWHPGEDVGAASPRFNENALKVLRARYLRRDAGGQIVETPEELFRRVAHHIAQAEAPFGGAAAAGEWEELFLDALVRLDFLPNSPTLMNAGAPLGQLSACFVLPVADSMESIFDSLKLMALVQQSGGGTGFSFSRLRPRGDVVASTGGPSSGPVSFMRIFDCATENIKQGGKRRGANMGVLRADHPDVEEFIDAKRDGTSFRNFNLSVGAPDAFMQAAAAGEPWTLRHPRTGQPAAELRAADLLTHIAEAAWQTGDPGLIFLDAVNRYNPTPDLGLIEATNPCGEVGLLPYESCNLGSVNLSHMARREARGHAVDWEKLARTARLGVRFLDDVIEVGRWPVPQIAEAARANRKIGLGVMGFAEMLILLGIPYASDAAVRLADELMRFLNEEALAASRELAQERGVFPNWERSVYSREGLRLRNATRTSIAPTGTLSILAGTSASIEPLYALAYRRQHVLGEQSLIELNPLFLRYARQEGLYSEGLMQSLLTQGSLTGVAGIPPFVKELFRTALEISPEDHLRIQAAFQRHTDNAVSKTINLPHSATAEEIADIYRRAWELGLKGITVYRSGSKGEQVFQLGVGETPEEREHFARCDPHACKL
jgi:adenosylcobalamin-dependent ribonucleoside-diphosphate reductase